MDRYIYTKTQGVHVLDLSVTEEKLPEALEFLNKVSDKGYVLMVGTKKQAANLVKEAAQSCGAFYITTKWPAGLFTNFNQMGINIRNLVDMEEKLAKGVSGNTKKEKLILERKIKKLLSVYEGVRFMDKLPAAIVVFDTTVEKIAVKEANEKGIPVIAMIDSNSDPDCVDYPVPANDDAIGSIKLFVDIFADAIKGGSFAEKVQLLRKDHAAKLKRLKEDLDRRRQQKNAIEEGSGGNVSSVQTGAHRTKIRVVRSQVRSIEELDLPKGLESKLMTAGIRDVETLKEKSDVELKAIKGLGAKTVETIQDKLKEDKNKNG